GGVVTSVGSNPADGRARTCPRTRWRACCRRWTSCSRLTCTACVCQDAVEVTSTFKLMKTRLVREGFNVGIVVDPLFVLDNQAQSFRPLTAETYQAVCEGTWRL
uniref:Solute carrier family 27 member 5 n=1 Tax=Theropithecus gelada TaxID=9565 RepID=A0A8D2FJK1_THEGE